MVTGALETVDVFIAGGGPAGLACAIACRRKGLSVLVADGMKPPIDKACGEGMMPDTLAALAQLGIRVEAEAEEVAPIQGIRFIDSISGRTAQALFHAGDGRGMKRTRLHQLLLDGAATAGVRFRWETVVRGIFKVDSRRPVVETNRGPVQSRFIVGADGHQSRIRACANLDRASVTSRRIGLRQHFSIAPWTGLVEVHWSGHGQAYVTPVSSNEVCVAFVAREKFHGGVAEALGHFPQLQSRLAHALPSDLPRGSVTLSRKLRRVTRGSIALLGDASGSVDAVTGEGLSLCFRQALALADAIAANDLVAYQRSHTAMGRLPHIMAATMLLMDRYPLLRSVGIAGLERCPQTFAFLLQAHIGAGPRFSRAAAGFVPWAAEASRLRHNAVR